ncbi:uncharacterized protein LOC128326693 isoform X1 [Hemicordylus capensis]|uniref:uncharacterized protein LOC128326693 isoform X1 n=1 Tax=Hemicordylus capensis TaxID=884348 RepID=UPI0023036731|nr:uncharacterized protein LOC128326693 isoform X1 [Hemicordylus capensis]XP_053109989.1 uncharacterized protein LOC128326693 isoform X1 [Hemicordylus capensis]XP_053109990.1 uncharacterized protein LOC128326693 isoform X1 [Hemicordylus capensis]XP_053109991.1 uncharacterized protein LOC128326693 isoform X1 [Hemicordylus capensis]XP_053109992.1 uncharacterized protein LOC128326693 isoform X1 [Hemicordylus capensis]XP_053109993.1 uncharacterized protein LOC128326693 isoform X1 [Hemicordylus cap
MSNPYNPGKLCVLTTSIGSLCSNLFLGSQSLGKTPKKVFWLLGFADSMHVSCMLSMSHIIKQDIPPVVYLDEVVTYCIHSALWVGTPTISPLSWTDHHLVKVGLTTTSHLRRGEGPIRMVHPKRLLDPVGFQEALEGFNVGSAGDPVDALVENWNNLLTRAVDTIAPKCPLRPASKLAPWYTEDLRGLKRQGRRLERKWRKTRLKSDRLQHGAHLKIYAPAIRAAKKRFFSARIASASSRPVELFRVVRGLVSAPSPLNQNLEASVTRCGVFNEFFTDKISWIQADLDGDSTINLMSELEVSDNSSYTIRLDQFQFVTPDDVDKLLGAVRPTTCSLDPCPTWLVLSSREAGRNHKCFSEGGQDASLS